MDEYAISIILITCSALFSGLTLGYFTLNIQNLERQARLGNQAAARVLPVRTRGNQLLTTLLLGNVAVNAILSVYLSSIASGVVAATAATTLIFLFGEIIPQAVISRYALYFGAQFAPLVRVLMWVLSPIAYPVAYVLDRSLGEEIPSMYSHHELMAIISEHEHSEHSQIDKDEERIVHGALQFSHTTVREVMTNADNVMMYEEHQRLTPVILEEMNEYGYSRYPVYSGNRANVVGLLYVKDLIIEADDIPINQTAEAYERTFLAARAGEKLDVVLARMLKQRRHLAMVYSRNQQFVGVISLEDIIEEIIQVEIEDEDDD